MTVMTQKDLDHLRLWTSNVMPSRIQLQFCETEFQLFLSTTCRAGRFPVLSRISGAGAKLMGGSALSKELFRLQLVGPIPVLQQADQLHENTFLQLLSHPSASHLFSL